MKKVYRVELKVGFDCSPKLEINCQECELDSRGKILPPNEKNAKMSMDLLERRVVLTDNFSSPGAEVFCYLERIDGEDAPATVQKLYEDAQRTMQWLSRIFSDRVDKMRIPSPEEVAKSISYLTTDSRGQKKWVSKGELFELLASSTKKKADEMILGTGIHGERLAEWPAFCERHLTEDLFQGQMESLRSVEQFDGKFGFASEESFATAISDLPEVTAKDLVELFKQHEMESSRG